jgi:23S rRNA (pseudouridine1915-N3)-methyltransferase
VSQRVLVLSVGSPKHPGIVQSIRDYEARAGHYFALESIEVHPKKSGGANPTRVRRDEAEVLLRRLPDDMETFALTRNGRSVDTRGLADHLERVANYGPAAGTAFVIGGAFGLDETVVEKCKNRLSLSALTLPHELARLVLTEQLYRVGTLLRGEPYHKGS